MTINTEQWYRSCLRQLGCELSGDNADQIKDGLHLFVSEPSWLQYVLQESGWFEQKALVAGLNMMGSADASLTIHNPERVDETLFLNSTGCANTDSISLVYGERLSEDTCQFLRFLGWSDRAEALDVDFGATRFESTLLSIQRGDWMEITTIADLLVDAESSKAKSNILTGSDNAGDTALKGKHISMSAEQLVIATEPFFQRKPINAAYAALQKCMLKQTFDNPKDKNLVLYNKVADDIEEVYIAGKYDGELKVVAQTDAEDASRPKVIMLYVRNNDRNWTAMTKKGFERHVRDCKNALKKCNL